MELVVLGSGSSVPHPSRASAAHWLQTAGGSLLLDISAAAVHRMAQEGLDWVNLDAIWVSHFHLDHLGGLAPYLFGMKHAPPTQSRRRALKIYGPEGLAKLLGAVDDANAYGLLKQPFPVEIHEQSPGAAFELWPGLSATTLSTPHTRESLALRLEEAGGPTIVYTSDTGPAEALAGFAAGVDLLLIECSFRREKPIEKHLKLSEAMEIARRAAPRQVLLTHLYPEWDDYDVAAEARRLWPGETRGAADGLRLRVERKNG